MTVKALSLNHWTTRNSLHHIFYIYLILALLGLRFAAPAFPAAESRGFSLLVVLGLSLWWLLLLKNTGRSVCAGFSSCSFCGSRAWARQLWCTGLVAFGMWDIPGRDQSLHWPCVHYLSHRGPPTSCFIQVSIYSGTSLLPFFFKLLCNSAAMNILMPISIWISVFIFLGCILRSAIADQWYFDF